MDTEETEDVVMTTNGRDDDEGDPMSPANTEHELEYGQDGSGDADDEDADDEDAGDDDAGDDDAEGNGGSDGDGSEDDGDE